MTVKRDRGNLLVVGGPAGLSEALEALLDPRTNGKSIARDESLAQSGGAEPPLAAASGRPVIMLSPNPERDECESWLNDTREIFAQTPTAHVVLLSSMEVYSPDHHSLGMVEENAERRPTVSNARAEFWEAAEAGIQEFLPADQLLILRSAHVIGHWAEGWFNRLLRRKLAVTVMGYDPSIQLIHETDFVRAVHSALENRLTGVYNVASRDALPLRKILQACSVRRLPLPWALLRLRRRASFAPADRSAYLRYSCTGCGARFARETEIGLSTVRALEQFLGEKGTSSLDLADYSDPHGLDAPFINRAAKGRFKFLEKAYWRIERTGFEHIPDRGPAILVGPHRGFMPVDAVMLVQMVTNYTKRVPRFLLHPSLVKLPILARFMRRMGGVMACKKNANGLLERGELLGIYPEGIRGPFKYYKDVYDLGRFGRPDYALFALEHAAPVIPFVIVGCAEIYPIFGKLKWNWVKKILEWPCLPITPTFPFLPFPLPTKWHLQILPPIEPARAIEEAERTGREPCQVIVEQVKTSIQRATSEMLEKRKSIFFGSVFAE